MKSGNSDSPVTIRLAAESNTLQRTDSRRVLAFYTFVPVGDPATVQQDLQQLGEALQIKGTILLANEGVNGTVVGTPEGLGKLQQALTQWFGELPFKWSEINVENPAFLRYKVRVKPEIVSFGVPDLDLSKTGTHVGVAEWNDLLSDPEVVVIDTRNQYEIDIGTFRNAVSPQTNSFREFPEWVEENLKVESQPRIAMFCTGGIRCEKASSYLLQQGFGEVYQLDGGILRYLENVAPDDSLWDGECFVFDQRVSVTPELTQGQYQQCFACRHPLSEADLKAPEFEQGVSCPHCLDAVTEERRQQFRERQKQIALARQRGQQHIGQQQKRAGQKGSEQKGLPQKGSAQDTSQQ